MFSISQAYTCSPLGCRPVVKVDSLPTALLCDLIVTIIVCNVCNVVIWPMYTVQDYTWLSCTTTGMSGQGGLGGGVPCVVSCIPKCVCVHTEGHACTCTCI